MLRVDDRKGCAMGLRAELSALVARANDGDLAEAEGASRQATSIRDVLAGARDVTEHPAVRAALDDGLAAAEGALRELETLLSSKRAGAPSSTGTEPPPPARGSGASKKQAWPPSGEFIDQAAEGLEKLAAGVTSVLGQLAREFTRAADQFARAPDRCGTCGATIGAGRFCPRCGAARS